MERLNIQLVYEFGHDLRALANLSADAPVRDFFWLCGNLHFRLKFLFEEFSSLNMAIASQQELLASIKELWEAISISVSGSGGIDITEAMSSIGSEQLTSLAHSIPEKAKALEIVLLAELQSLSTYIVTPIGIYSGTGLVERAEDVLPPKVKAKLSPFVIEEINQSGRCLAFGVATASGFHILRATEKVMRDYYVRVVRKPGERRSKLPTWTAYIRYFEKNGDTDTQRIVAILQQVKDHDRNLIMHPESSLSEDEAHTLFEVAKGAIMAMAEKLPKEDSKAG